MHKVDRREAIQQLQSAWRHEAHGEPNRAVEHIREALDILEESLEHFPAATVRNVRRYIQDGRLADLKADRLGMLLATLAALQELQGK